MDTTHNHIHLVKGDVALMSTPENSNLKEEFCEGTRNSVYSRITIHFKKPPDGI